MDTDDNTTGESVSPQNQKGFTLVEILTVFGILIMLSAIGAGVYIRSMELKRMEIVKDEVQIVLKVGEQVRVTGTFGGINPINGAYIFNYQNLPPGSDIATLEAVAGRQTGVGNNPWGFPYTIQVTDRVVVVTTIIPGEIGAGAIGDSVVYNNGLDQTTVSFSGLTTPRSTLTTDEHARQVLYAEPVR